jgi:hypothetical protein
MWALIALAAVSGLWVLKIEVVYRQNVSRMPALLNYHRRVENRLWKA